MTAYGQKLDEQQSQEQDAQKEDNALNEDPRNYKLKLQSDNGINIKAYFVRNVPVGFATFRNTLIDDNYISHESGYYPDWLEPITDDMVVINDIYRSVWVRANGKYGEHTVTLLLADDSGETCAEKTVKIEILPIELPKQELIYTQWFHTDCIYDYYGCKPFSHEHWCLIEKFLDMAYDNGITMILTPVFTPPLDTAVGGERPTVQLVKIKTCGDKYEFDFDRLNRWIVLCKKIGFEYFEMPHLFTQWGAKFAPKIMADEDGVQKQIFGWDIASTSSEYENFLSQFIPALKTVLAQQNVLSKTYFHVSDEPFKQDFSAYAEAYKIAKRYLNGCKIIDALSDFQFYQNGIIKIPVPSTDHIDPFLDADIDEKWCYYCCMQNIGVSNRFIVMPSARNRSIGLQLYKYGMNGFLHWGYNFYYTQYSRCRINPFCVTDADGAFPSGDSFSVYPGKDGPNPAIGLFVFNEALQDIRTLKLLESFIGKSEVLRLIESALGKEIKFSDCFGDAEISQMRRLVNEKIKEYIQ